MIARNPLDLLDEPRTRGDYQLAALYAQLDVATSKLRVQTVDELIKKRIRQLDGQPVKPDAAELEDGDDTELEPDLADALGI